MISITCVCDKCNDVDIEEFDSIPSQKDWLKAVHRKYRNIYVDGMSFTVCEACLKEWDLVDKKKDKEKKEDFFPEQSSGPNNPNR
jgi:hypothetical protein